MYPWEQDGDWIWGFFDRKLGLLESNFLHNRIVSSDYNIDVIRQACNVLYNKASRTGTTKRFWEGNKRNGDVGFSIECRSHAWMSMKQMSLKHVVCTRVSLHSDSKPPDIERIVQITLLPICLERSPYYGQFFWLISYRLREPGVVGDLGPLNEIVDLTIV